MNDQVKKVNVKFIGDPNDDFSGPSKMPLWGHVFPKGEFIAVPQSVADKCSTHNHFLVEGDETDHEARAALDALEPDVLRNILDRRGVEYKGNASGSTLRKLVAAGGEPTAEELG